MSSVDTLEKIKKEIIESIPPEVKLTHVEFEGPEIAIYSKNSKMLVDDNEILRTLAKKIRKRIVIRSDPEVRMSEEETINLIKNLVPPEAEITKIIFDSNLGELTIEAKKPGLVIGKQGVNLKEIRSQTLWRPKTVRSPPIESKTISTIRSLLAAEAKNQKEIMIKIGRRIHRPQLLNNIQIKLTPLGGSREVGRSCILVQTNESSVLLDCGLNIGDPQDIFPKLNSKEFDLENLDAVIVSHAHMDHSGLVPFLFKYGYEGPIYCTEPTRNLMVMLQLDYIDLAEKEGYSVPYGKSEIKKEILHTIPLTFGKVTDISPDIKLTLHNSGHILGSSIVHLHFGNGDHNLVYTGDFKYQRTRLLEPASFVFPRLETLITEATYGGIQDVIPSKHESERNLANIINSVVTSNSKILIPVLAVGRAQELMIVLEEFVSKKIIPEIPIYLDGMISEAIAIHTAHPEYLNIELREKIFHQGKNPFLSPIFKTVTGGEEERLQIINGGPSIIMSTNGMLQGGPAIFYLRHLAENEKNVLLFVGYQVEGTLGRRIQRGFRDLQFEYKNGQTNVVKLKMKVHTIRGFSGHSSRSQIMSFIRKVRPRPEKIITNHGEAAKCMGLASVIHKRLKTDTKSLMNEETIILKTY